MKLLLTKTRPLSLAYRKHLMPFSWRGLSKIVSEEETIENMRKRLENQMNEKQDLHEGFDRLKVENANDRSSIVKNLSLQLLDVESPQKILEIFQTEYLEQTRYIHVEELFMLLYFFKTQVRELHDDSAR